MRYFPLIGKVLIGVALLWATLVKVIPQIVFYLHQKH